ncbi:trypsin-7-like [Trichoplusia ni]|uniref:Trypsin-7-like n=1 Tax=Trichoplusia ni TaxID=7111 RepID=A0A7E5W037_TRINI|nr:trypsin-7-like [Trichoplusia ni]
MILSHSIHPMFGHEHKFDYDVQLLKLFRGLYISKLVSPIIISGGECGENIYVSGWGYPQEKGEYQDTLQQARMGIVSMEECQEVEQSWYNHTLTSRMFCAGGWSQDACQGDSGGAAVSFGRLVGLSSFGFGCGRKLPGVYANVSEKNIREWIRYYTGI